MNYTLTLSARDTGRSSYYAICFGSEVTVVQAAYDFTPTAAARTMFAVWPIEIQVQFPPSSVISGSAVMTTSERFISGEILISPALTVPVMLELFGLEKIAELTVQPGETRVDFRFDV